MKKLLMVTVLLVGWCMPWVVLAATPEPVAELVEVAYIRTVDGDTIEVATPERGLFKVRLFAVDSLELTVGTVAAFEAALWVAGQLEGAATVHLEYDGVARVDKYGRDLAWVWYETHAAQHALLLNLELVRGGRATLYPETQSSRYAHVLQNAAEAVVGGTVQGTKYQVESYDVDVLEYGLRWTTRSKNFAQYSWRVDLDNNTARKMWVNIHIGLYDVDGFQLSAATMYRKLLPPGEHSFSAEYLMDASLADSVEDYWVAWEEVR